MNKFLCVTLLSTCMALTHGGLFSPLPVAYAQEASAPVKIDHLAILDFEAKGGMSKDEASIITERFRAQLLRSGRFRIMERAKMQEILKEQGFQESGLCDTTECSVELGRLLSVNRILTGSVNKFGNIYSLSARIMDVEKGNIVVEEFEDCECRLEDLLTRSTALLVAKLTGTGGPVATPTPTAKPTPLPTPVPTQTPRPVGSLQVHSVPEGAEVFLNGRVVGRTPMTVNNQTPGTYSLRVIANGYQDYQQDIKITAGTNTLNITLVQQQENNNGWVWGVVIGGLLAVAGVVGVVALQGGGSGSTSNSNSGSSGSTTNTGGVTVTW